MTTLHVSVERPIAAPADALYRLLADYEDGHPRILPPEYFSRFRIEHGGQGEGTVILFSLRLMGRQRSARALITEPEPGRVLRETMLGTEAATTFTLDPLGDGSRTRVRIETRWQVPRWRAAAERLLATPLLRRIYERELKNLSYEIARAQPPVCTFSPA